MIRVYNLSRDSQTANDPATVKVLYPGSTQRGLTLRIVLAVSDDLTVQPH